MKILITNIVPLNAGDEALLISLFNYLKNRYPGVSINICTNKPNLCNKHFQHKYGWFFLWDLEYVYFKYSSSSIFNRLRYKCRLILKNAGFKEWFGFALIFASREERKTIKAYRDSDMIISAPGGYLHEYYGLDRRFDSFEKALEMGKKVYIIGQSLGPFTNETKDRAQHIFKQFAHINVREKNSQKFLFEIGVSQNVSLSSDMAFCLQSRVRNSVSTSSKPKIVMLVREWLTEENNHQIAIKMRLICAYLIKYFDAQITFLSTCQGITGYRDDSEFASYIVSELDQELKQHIQIDKKRYYVDDLIKQLSSFDAYIGMRLHGSILSMLGGTPAFLIGYEPKADGIFEQLTFSDFCANFKDDYEVIERKITYFLSHLDDVKKDLPARIAHLKLITENQLDKIFHE